MKICNKVDEFLAKPQEYYCLNLENKVSEEVLQNLRKKLFNDSLVVEININKLLLRDSLYGEPSGRAYYDSNTFQTYNNFYNYYPELISEIKFIVAQNKARIIGKICKKIFNEIIQFLNSDVTKLIIDYISLEDLVLMEKEAIQEEIIAIGIDSN